LWGGGGGGGGELAAQDSKAPGLQECPLPLLELRTWNWTI